MKKHNFALSIAAISASFFGFFLTLLPDFFNALDSMGTAYGSLFHFSLRYGVLNTVLFLFALASCGYLIFLCIQKKSYWNLPVGPIFFLSFFLFFIQSKPLMDGLPLLGTSLAGCIFAFLGMLLGNLLAVFLILELQGVPLPGVNEQPGPFAKKSPRAKILIGSFSSVGIVLLSALLTIGASMIGGANSSHAVADHVDVSSPKKAYFAEGRGTYDLNGNLFTLRGVNYGNYFLQEGWIGPLSLGPALNEDGSYVKVNEEGIVEEYEQVYQEDLIQAFKDNPNLTAAQVETLWDAYYLSYCQNEDFVNIKNLGLNGIRLPMYWGNFMEGEAGNLKLKAKAFVSLDRFLKLAKDNGLVVVLDMHGVEGGQSGYEHCGTHQCDFWDNEVYQKDMANLWQTIALHYRDDRPDLFSTIFAYDLVNEPTPKTQNGCVKKQWDVMDKLYDAIREVDEDHIIMFEGVWEFSNLPSHKAYGWENIVYQFHAYNWNHSAISDDLWWAGFNMALCKSDTSVPYYIGEFTFFDNPASWGKMLKQFDEWHYSWTLWTYKVVSVGWWDNSWGVYVNKMNLKNNVLKVDVRTATFDELYAVMAHQGTSEAYNNTGVTYQALKDLQASQA